MKKSVEDTARPVQERENETLPSQKPGNDKPKRLRYSLKAWRNRISTNDFRFLKTIKLEQNMPAHPDTTRDVRYAPTEKPW